MIKKNKKSAEGLNPFIFSRLWPSTHLLLPVEPISFVPFVVLNSPSELKTRRPSPYPRLLLFCLLPSVSEEDASSDRAREASVGRSVREQREREGRRTLDDMESACSTM